MLSLVALPNLLLAFAAASGLLEVDAAEGTLEVTEQLVASFNDALARQSISLRLIVGDWRTFDAAELKLAHVSDLVLSSETVYRDSAIPSLIAAIRAVAAPDATTLIAAKTLYFGLDGGELAFRQHVDRLAGAAIEERWRGGSGGSGGVERVVLDVRWP